MRCAVIGNSGSGKSTLAQWLSQQSGAPILDLDTIAWLPGQIAVPRIPSEAVSDVQSFCRSNSSWIVERCYADLIRATFEFQPRLIFLNPGSESCVNNCRSRPWEPHKYPSKEEQDQRLAFLLAWVQEYYTRSGDMSLEGHQAVFDEYPGLKTELTSVPAVDRLLSSIQW